MTQHHSSYADNVLPLDVLVDTCNVDPQLFDAELDRAKAQLLAKYVAVEHVALALADYTNDTVDGARFRLLNRAYGLTAEHEDLY